MRGGPAGVGLVVGGNVVNVENVFSQMSTFQIKLRDASTSQRAQDPSGSSANGFEVPRVQRGVGPRFGQAIGDVDDEPQRRAFAPLVHERHPFAAGERLVVRRRHPERCGHPDRLRSNSSASTEL